MRRRYEKQHERRRLANGLFMISLALHLFCCKWTTDYAPNSPSALAGVKNTAGCYARRTRKNGLMLGIFVPTALLAVAGFVACSED